MKCKSPYWTRLLPILLATCAAFWTHVWDRSWRGYPLPPATQANSSLTFYCRGYMPNSKEESWIPNKQKLSLNFWKFPFPNGLKVILLHREIRKTRLATRWRVVVSWVYAKQKVVSTSTWFQAQFSQAKYPAMLGVVGQQCSVCLHLGIIQFWELYFMLWFSDTQVLLSRNPKTQSSSL